MAGKSKAKGNRNEYEVARVLQKWWNVPGETFTRMPASGALRWGGTTWTYGDILPPLSFRAVVETKHHREVSLAEPFRLDVANAKLTYWWYYQCVPDAVRCRTELDVPVQPFCIWRKNHGIFQLCTTTELHDALGVEFTNQFVHYRIHVPTRKPFVLCGWSDWMNAVTPAAFRKACIQVSEFPLM